MDNGSGVVSTFDKPAFGMSFVMASFSFLDSTPKDLDERAYPWLLNGLVRGYQA